MINSLLKAQSATSGIAIERQPCNLNDLIDSIILESEPIAKKNGAIVNYKITDDLPIIDADSLQLWRVYFLLPTYYLFIPEWKPTA